MDLPEQQDERTIMRIGNSSGVTLSKGMLESLDLDQGDQVKVVKFEGDDHAMIVPADADAE